MKMNEQEFHAAVMNQLDTCRAGVDKVFFTKYANGELTEEALRDYYGVVYHECQYFVRCLSLIHAKAERKDAREIIAQNLCEEYANGEMCNNHPGLMLHFNASLGLDPEVIEANQNPEIYKEWFATVWGMCQESFLEGLSMLCFHEHEVTTRFVAMRKALTTHYGAKDDDLRYFDEHISEGNEVIVDPKFPGYGGDDVHVARQLEVLVKYADSEESQQKVLDAIALAAEARTKLNQKFDESFGRVN